MNNLDFNAFNDKISSSVYFIKYTFFKLIGYEAGLTSDPTIRPTETAPSDKSYDLLSSLGLNIKKDTDGDGVPDINDAFPNDPNNFTDPKIRELFSNQLSTYDNIRAAIGLSYTDVDRDGIPDSVENYYKTNPSSPDTDSDGVYDGEEIYKGSIATNPDTDNDGVVDGRDAFPLNKFASIYESDIDSDTDGVGDRFEKLLGTDPYIADTDSDGLRDGLDPSPFTHESKVIAMQHSSLTDGLSFTIQNKLLSFLSDILTVLTLLTLPLAIFVFFRWYWEIKKAVEHYYHMFHDAYGYKEAYGHASHDYLHDIKSHKEDHKAEHKNDNHHTEAHISHELPTELAHAEEGNHTEAKDIFAPKTENKQNEKWNMIKGYMSEPGEVFWRMGVIEADAMLTNYLDSRAGAGSDFASRLDGLHLNNVDDIWQAHRIRNRIAHEGASYKLTEREARLAINAYESAFLKLGII